MASEDEVAQVAQAIAIASDPSQSTLHPEALQFISSIQSNASTTWRLGLALFAGSAADGTRKYPPQARFFGLRILDEFLDNRFEPLEEQTFQVLQQGLISYIQSEYQYGPAEAGATFLRNRFSRTLTLFFLCTYLDRWQSFFDDIFTLIRPPTTQEVPQFNPHVSLLLFHLILEISGEVADQMLKAARPFDNRRHARDGRVRDAVRDRDASAINEAVLTIVADSVEKMSEVRKGDTSLPANTLIEVIDWGVRAFGSYVGWIDINLTVTPSTIPLLFGLLSDPSLPIRLATAAAFVKLVGKGLKQPGDKLQLIKVLALGQVIDTLEQKTREEQTNRGDDTDDGEESYREALSRLLNILGLELSKLMEDNDASHDVRMQANVHREQLMPTMLRFLGDAYDDTSCTVFPLLSTVLLNYKKLKQSSGQLTGVQQAFLSNTLNVLLEKLKWEEEDDPDEMDEDERHVFESLRGGELRVHIDSIFSIDPELTSSMIHQRVMTSLTAYENGSNNLKWNEAELSIYLIYIYGDINKSGGKGRVAFCHAPSAPKDFRKERDYSQFPLTHHGEMLFELVRSGIVSYPHPFVSMQFFETCARYGDFFKVRKECIIPLLEAMVDSRGLHHPTSGFRTRVYYLFYKFVREDKNEISGDLAVTLLNGVSDLFEIEVELPEPSSAEHLDLLTASIENPGMFDSQLNLFEAAGILISITYKNPEQARALLLSVVTPLLNSLSQCLQVTIRGPEDVFSIVKVHHIIMALGNVAKGFPDIPFPIPPNHILPPVDVFREISQAILVSLEAMNAFKVVRDATRFAFTRIVATAGSSVTDLIPILMTSLLAHFERSELVDFMHFIGLLMHRLQHELFDVLDQLIGPLGERVTELLSQPATGTDDKLAYADTKKGYMNLLNNIMVNQLHGVLISDKNKTRFESLMQNMEQVAQDCNDPACARIAISFLTRCINVWGSNQAIPVNGNGHPNISPEPLPGFERFIYEHLVPLVFALPLQPSFNIKDGQMIVMLHELASLLQSVMKARGQEAYDFLVSVFLPAQNCPPDAAVDFASNIRDLDSKSFRKFFAEFIRSSRPAGS